MYKRVIVCLAVFLLASSLFLPSGQASSETTGEQVVDLAKDYLGVPYQMGGTTPSGFDCSGFVQYVFNLVGIELPRTSSEQAGAGEAVEESDLQPGDIVYFKNTYKSSVSHTGIYIGDQKFISATSSSGVKIDSINDPYYWGSRYAGARRVIEEPEAEEAQEEAEEVQVEEAKLVLEPLAPGEYYDVPEDYWAAEAISSLSKQGIINGYHEGLFQPEETIKRAEAAKMLSETLNLKAAGSIVPYSDISSSHWAYEYVMATTEKEYFTGYGGNTFKPDEPITRAEVASILVRVFELSASEEAVTYSDLSPDHWAYEDIQKLSSNEITSGYSDQTFRASENITRAEFSSFLYRAMEK